MSEPTPADLAAVAGLLDGIVRVQACPAVERGGEPGPDGAIQMPYVELAPEVSALIDAIYRHHVMSSFDWTTWKDEARGLLDEARLATASLDEVRRLLTLHVRQDRFVEGHLAEMVRIGHVAAILRRLGALIG